MSLKLINAGFGRTGTMSIKLALEQLGLGPCHHMEEVIKNPHQIPYWQQAADGEMVNWDEVFAGYHCAVDWPSAHYWRELAGHFPEARVLLSVRPPQRWWQSFSGTIKKLLAMQGEIDDDTISSAMHMANQIITEQTFGGRVDDQAHMLAVFQQRIDEVRAAIPAERLLVFEVTQGWQPLCEFLDLPIPETGFPRTNSTAEFWEVFGAGQQP